MPPTRIAAMIALTLAIVPLTACPPFGAPGNPSASPSPTQPPNPGTSGSLDTHFGEAGVATAEVTPDWEDIAYGVAVQSDGKIVLAGTTSNSALSKTGVARFTAAGKLDAGFGTQGTAVTVKDVSSWGYGLVLQADGRIVVGGRKQTSAVNNTFDFLASRFTTAGAPDGAFGSQGHAVAGMNLGYGRAIAKQPDGKLVMTGRGGTLIEDDAQVVRFTADGVLDTSFAGDGTATFDWGSAYDEPVAVEMLGNGQIIVAGKTDAHASVLCRVNSDGTLDTAFGTNGLTKRALGEGNAIRDMAIGSDGRIVVVGGTVMQCYLPDGTLDEQFGTQGQVMISGLQAQAVALQADGKVVVAGKGASSVVVTRLTSTGAVDAAFGSQGKADLAEAVTGGNAHDVVIQADGKILVAGSESVDEDDDFMVLRLWP